MSWQPGDVSPEARRAAETAADAAGMPLGDWVAQTVRAAIIRELGRIPSEDPEAGPEPLAGPPVDSGTFAPAPNGAAGPAISAIAEPEPVAPAPSTAVEPQAEASISEPTPLAAEPAAPADIPEPFAPVRTPSPLAGDTRRVSRGTPGLPDRAFTSWLATRIQGLPADTLPGRQSALNNTRPTAPPTPSPPAPSRPQIDLPLAQSPVPPDLQRPAPVPPRGSGAAPLPLASTDGAAPPLSLPSGPVTILPLTSLRPARIRARRLGDADPAILALAASVASQGVREPILVRRLAESTDQYEVLAGERRRAAAHQAGRANLPAVVVEAGDAEALLLSLAENLGRGDFSPLDEAQAYLRLMTEFRTSAGTLAQRLARERSHIALSLRLLGLPPRVRQLIDSGRLGSAQAFALLNAPDPEVMADQMIKAAGGRTASEPA